MGDISRERFRTGNRVEIFTRGPGSRQLLGKGFTGRMGEATSVTANSNTGARGLYVVGTPHPQGIVDGQYSHDIRLSLIQLVNRAAADIINSDYIDIDIIDKYSNTKIKTMEECRITSGSLEVPANNPVAENVSFLAMRVVTAAAA